MAMQIPGFTAGMSLYRRGERYGSEAKPARRNNSANGDTVPAPRSNSQVVPAQVLREPCLWIHGSCTPPSGGTSFANNHGFRQVCRGPSQMAWVEVCRWPSGTGRVTSVDKGCDPCGADKPGPPPPPPPPPNPCPSGTPCAGGCCPPGSPVCTPFGDGTGWCCPSSFPVARRLPFVGPTCLPF